MHLNTFYRIYLLLLFTVPFVYGQASDSLQNVSLTDSTITFPQYFQQVRGLEREAYRPGSIARKTLNCACFLPRLTVDILLTATGVGAVLIDEKKVIKKFENIFYLYQRKLGWYPVLSYVSGFSEGFGLSLFYRENYFSGSLKAAYGGQDNWRSKLSLSHTFFLHRYHWRTHFSVQVRSSDDLRFYGIGTVPSQDSRSFFLPQTDQEYGLYRQRRLAIEYALGVRPAGDWQIYFSTLYSIRKIGLPRTENAKRLDQVFDLKRLPGYNRRSGHWYYELAIRFDNRENLKQTVPGIRAELFAGHKLGTLNDSGNLLLAGIDLTAFINVIHQERYLLPRTVFTVMAQTDEDVSTAFVDYPRHPAFRGISSKALLRNDNYSLLNSLEYQWPLTYNLKAAIFFDHLLVGETLTKMTLRQAPWVAGFGLEAHTSYSELARIFLAYGSQGIVVKATFGFSSRYKSRTNWR